MYRSRQLQILSAMIAMAMFTNAAVAQTSSLFGSRGPIGQSSGASSSVTATNRNSGSLLSGTVGGNAQSSIDTQAGTGGVSTEFGAGGLVGRGDSQGRFAGSQFAGQGGNQSTQNRFNASQFGGNQGRGNQFGGGNQFGRGNQFGSTARTATFRPQQRVAFTYRKPATAKVDNSLKVRFQNLTLRRPQFQGVSLNLGENGAVSLSGRVESDSTKRLLALLVRMEPGVRSVSNELTVSAVGSSTN